jgi:hypothetical protein
MSTVCWVASIVAVAAAAVLEYLGFHELALLVMGVVSAFCGGAVGAGMASRKR